jgi:hypothetical protein
MTLWQKLLIVLVLLFTGALVFGFFWGPADLVSEARRAAATCLTGRGTCSELHPDRTSELVARAAPGIGPLRQRR